MQVNCFIYLNLFNILFSNRIYRLILMNLVLISTKQTNTLLEFSLSATNGLKELERPQNIKEEIKHFQEA